MKLKQSFNKWVVKTHDYDFDMDNFYGFKTEEDILDFISGEYVIDYWDREVHLCYNEIVDTINHEIQYDIDWSDEDETR